MPATSASILAGDMWQQSMSSLALKVPSVIVPNQHNVLIKPAHPKFARIVFKTPIAHPLDKRLA